jgi:hypothetical protein
LTISSGDVVSIPRANPPAELTTEQRLVRQDVVNALPDDHFPRETHALLVSLLSTCYFSQEGLITHVEQAKKVDIEVYDRLGKMAARESRIISALACKMRLIPQQKISARKQRGTLTQKLWNTAE